jgi:DNA replication protein DnaC
VNTIAHQISPIMLEWQKRAERYETLSNDEKRAIDEKAEEAERQMAAQSRQNRARELFAASKAPRRQGIAKIEPRGAWGEKCGLLLKLVEGCATVGIVGGRGNGKTQMAVEAIRLACSHGKPCMFTTAMQFFMDLKATYRADALKDERAIVAMYARPHLLVIDEIGKRGGSDWENNLLFEVLNRRYENMKPSILIDNRTREDFLETIGPSLASRMSEGGGVIECTWETFR